MRRLFALCLLAGCVGHREAPLAGDGGVVVRIEDGVRKVALDPNAVPVVDCEPGEVVVRGDAGFGCAPEAALAGGALVARAKAIEDRIGQAERRLDELATRRAEAEDGLRIATREADAFFASEAATPYHFSAASCVPKDDAAGRYKLVGARLEHAGLETGPIVFFCPVIVPRSTMRWTGFIARYRDPDAAGLATRVTAKLRAIDAGGVIETLAEIDSNTKVDVGDTSLRAPLSAGGLTNDRTYFVELTLDRTDPTIFAEALGFTLGE